VTAKTPTRIAVLLATRKAEKVLKLEDFDDRLSLRARPPRRAGPQRWLGRRDAAALVGRLCAPSATARPLSGEADICLYGTATARGGHAPAQNITDDVITAGRVSGGAGEGGRSRCARVVAVGPRPDSAETPDFEQLYHYDVEGNLWCVTEKSGTGDDCDFPENQKPASVLEAYTYDQLDV
jgi:hypothetical protein